MYAATVSRLSSPTESPVPAFLSTAPGDGAAARPTQAPAAVRAPALIGILGGMGPLATTDLMIKIIEEVPAECDQQHVPVIAASIPQIPSRIDALVAGGPTPLPAMLDVLRRLERAGAAAIAMPCNTAHAWYDELVRATRLPILHIVECALGELEPAHERIGVLASAGTVRTGLYRDRLRRSGRQAVELAPADQAGWVDGAIAAVKAGRIDEAAPRLQQAVRLLAHQGAQSIVLACTEIPVALAWSDTRAARVGGAPVDWVPPVPLVDATRALARACVGWSTSHEAAVPRRLRAWSIAMGEPLPASA